MSKICEMATVMKCAISSEESQAYRDQERMTQLEVENGTLRELLLIGARQSGELSRVERGTQAGGGLGAVGGTGEEEEAEHHFVANDDMNSSVIENQDFSMENDSEKSYCCCSSCEDDEDYEYDDESDEPGRESPEEEGEKQAEDAEPEGKEPDTISVSDVECTVNDATEQKHNSTTGIILKHIFIIF